MTNANVFNASLIVFGSHFFSQLFRLVSNLIVTRLLVPEAFGLMAAAQVIVFGVTLMSDVGLSQNIIQSKRGEQAIFIHTAWSIQALQGVLICLFLVCLSLSLLYFQSVGVLDAGTVYSDARLPVIIASLSFVALLDGFKSPYLYVLNRRVELGAVVSIDLCAQLVGILVMILVAWSSQSIWALVIGSIVSSMMKLSLSHIILRFPRLRFGWDKDSLVEIIGFGKWIIASSFFGFLVQKGDLLILGVFVTAETLGYYSISIMLALAVQGVVAKLMSSVYFPVFGNLVRDDPDALMPNYYKIRLKLDFLCGIAAGLLFVVGSEVVSVLYDDRYSDSGWMLEILSLSILGVGYLLSSMLFLAQGKSGVFTLIAAVQAVCLYAIVPAAYWAYGLEVAIWAIALNFIGRIVVSLYLMQKYFAVNYVREFIIVPFFGLGYLVGRVVEIVFQMIK